MSDNEETEAWRRYREEQQARRKERLPVRTEAILSLQEHGISVEKKTEYQYRVDGKIDLYPIHRKFHIIRTNKRGTYPVDENKLLSFIVVELSKLKK